eukprot:jgi/Phyca11/533965/estExt2_fgenesh1_pg.C_PHYCAscaffold_190051
MSNPAEEEKVTAPAPDQEDTKELVVLMALGVGATMTVESRLEEGAHTTVAEAMEPRLQATTKAEAATDRREVAIKAEVAMEGHQEDMTKDVVVMMTGEVIGTAAEAVMMTVCEGIPVDLMIVRVGDMAEIVDTVGVVAVEKIADTEVEVAVEMIADTEVEMTAATAVLATGEEIEEATVVETEVDVVMITVGETVIVGEVTEATVVEAVGGGRGGPGGGRGEAGPGVGTVTGSGYETIGDPVSDPRLQDEWTGRAGVRDADQVTEAEFGVIRAVHDGRAAIYAPTELPWTSKTFAEVDPYRPSPTAPPPAAAGDTRRRGPPTFVVKIKLAETISTSSLADYYTNPDVNVLPLLQALNVVARYLNAQRLITEVKVFYAPGDLMELVLPVLNARSADDIRGLSDRDAKNLARALRKIEVVPTHRKDRKRAISGTSQPPRVRHEVIMDQVRLAGFENDPFLAAFGMKVDQRLNMIDGRIIDPPDVQYSNVSERPNNGQWNLRDKRLVHGATLRNWGVVIHANVGERDVQGFVRTLVNVARRSGMIIEDSNPYMIHMDHHRGAQVEELMKMCHKELEARNKGPPQLIMVIKQDQSEDSYRDIKRMSDTVLGVPSQCIVSQNVRNAKPQYCANVCLKINMKLGGKNSVLREPLPLVSTAPTIIIGADVEHPRPGMGSRPAIAGVVASMDRYSANNA